MKNYRLLSLALLLLCAPLSAQATGFEQGVPYGFFTGERSRLSVSSLVYKERKASMAWDFSSGDSLHVRLDTPFIPGGEDKSQSGITLWIYNETPQADSLRFECIAPSGEVSFRFSFRLAAAGWRACWIGFGHTQGNGEKRAVAGWRRHDGRHQAGRDGFPPRRKNMADRKLPERPADRIWLNLPRQQLKRQKKPTHKTHAYENHTLS